MRNMNTLRSRANKAIAAGLGIAAFVGVGLGLKHLNDGENASYRKEQAAAADILKPGIQKVGATVLDYVQNHPDDHRLTMSRDSQGDYRITASKITDGSITSSMEVILGDGPDGKPDPARTLMVHNESRSPGYFSNNTLVAPEGQKYDPQGTSSGYEGRTFGAGDLDGDGTGDYGYDVNTYERTGAYDNPATDRAQQVVDNTVRNIDSLMQTLARAQTNG